jgi:hypothetical protein
MSDIPFYQSFKLTKPTNTLHLSRKIGKGELSVFLKYEDGNIIKVLKVESFSGNKIILTEMVDPEAIKTRYKRECIGDYLEPIGKILRQDIFVEVFYKV